MAALFADENVHQELVAALRDLGYDVMTAYEAARANLKIPDADQLAYATTVGRTMLTNNRKHFHKLHRAFPAHAGIITYTRDPDTNASDSDARVRFTVAMKRKCPPDILEKLANDANETVRVRVAVNAKTPPGVLNLLRKDSSKLVADALASRSQQDS